MNPLKKVLILQREIEIIFLTIAGYKKEMSAQVMDGEALEIMYGIQYKIVMLVAVVICHATSGKFPCELGGCISSDFCFILMLLRKSSKAKDIVKGCCSSEYGEMDTSRFCFAMYSSTN